MENTIYEFFIEREESPLIVVDSSMSLRKTSSIYTGVYWHGYSGKWCARIRVNGERITLGYFDSEIDANNAYQDKLKSLSKG